MARSACQELCRIILVCSQGPRFEMAQTLQAGPKQGFRGSKSVGELKLGEHTKHTHEAPDAFGDPICDEEHLPSV